MITEINEGNIVKIYKKGILTKTIDLAPVDEIRSNLEQILLKRKNVKDRKHIDYTTKILEKIKTLNKDQLEYTITNLLGIITKYADLYQTILDNPLKEGEKMQKYTDFLRKGEEYKRNYPLFKEEPVKKRV